MQRTIRVKGKGKIAVKPDMIRLDIIANEVCKEYDEVIEKSALCIKKIKEIVNRAGLNYKELKTVKFDVDSKYESYRDKNGNYKSRLVGFQYTQKFYIQFPNDNIQLGKILYELSHCDVNVEFSIKHTVKDITAVKNELLAKAVAEAGLTLPVSLDLVTLSTMSFTVNQANSLKKSIEDATDGQIQINVMPIDKDNYYKATYLVNSGNDSDWDISTAVGWNPDYLDPRSYLNIYNPTNGDMLYTVGLNGTADTDNFEESDKVAMDAINLAEYGELYKAADAVTSSLDERYTAFAKVDAWLIANAFLIPVHCTTVLNTVSRVIPFTGPYSVAGQGGNKFKFVRIQKDITTNKDYYEAKEAWLAERAKNTGK